MFKGTRMSLCSTKHTLTKAHVAEAEVLYPFIDRNWNQISWYHRTCGENKSNLGRTLTKRLFSVSPYVYNHD